MAGSTSRVSPTRGQPIADPDGVRRKPSWKTKAARAAETRSPRSLQVGSTIRSQNRAIARSDWPWRSSQSAKEMSSSRSRLAGRITINAASARRAAARSRAERSG